MLSSGLTLAYREWGAEDASVRVLALHGWMDNAGTWDLVAPSLADAGHRVVALDFSGHGRSSHRAPHASYLAFDFCDDVLGFLLASGLVTAEEVAEGATSKPLVLLGHSMGGHVASLFAGAFPGLASSLVLVESVSVRSEEAPALPERLARSLTTGIKSRAALDKPKRLYADVDAAARTRQRNAGLIAKQRISLEGATMLAKRGCVSSSDADGVYFGHDRRVQAPSPIYLTEEQVLAFLRRIRAPSLLVEGIEGLFDTSKSPFKERLAAWGSKVRVDKVPGWHHLQADPDTADAVALAINRFLSLPACLPPHKPELSSTSA